MDAAEKIEAGLKLLAEGCAELPRTEREKKAGPYAFPGQFTWRTSDLMDYWDQNKSQYQES